MKKAVLKVAQEESGPIIPVDMTVLTDTVTLETFQAN